MTRERWALAAAAALVVVGGAALARETLPLRSLLGLADEGPCVPSLSSVRLPGNETAEDGRWERAAPYPVARDEVRAAEVDGAIYVGTGVSLDDGKLTSLDEVFRFDPRGQTYEPVAPVPTRVDHPAFVGHAGALYVIGGYVDELPTAASWRYSPETGRWEELPSMRVARGSPAAAPIDGKIYVIGGSSGEQGSTEPTATVEIYDVATGSWADGPDLRTPRHHHAAAASGDRIVVLGGRGDEDLSLDAVEQLDVSSGEWAALPALPLGSGGLAAVAVGDAIVAIAGGDDAESWVTPATWKLDPGTSTWARLADLNVARHGLGAAAVGPNAYVFGGAPCPGYGRTDVVESLRVAAGTST